MKKLLLTTALAAVAISGSAYSEIKVSGEIVQTITSQSYDKATSQVNGSSAIGSEANVKFSGSKALTNGMTVGAAIRMEDKGGSFSVDQKAFNLSQGGFKVELGIDTGSSTDGNLVANVGQQAEDMGITTSIIKANVGTAAHDREHIGFSYKADMGEFTVNYSPSLASSVQESTTTDTGGSALEYVYQGGLGVEGLTVKIGQQVTKAANDSASGASGGEKTETVMGVMYKMGKVALAYTDRDMDDDTITTEISSVKSASVSYNVSDNLSVSIERAEATQLTKASKEKATLIGVGYNMGGLGLEAYYMTSDSIAGTSGNDGNTVQLRTVFGF